MDILNKLLNLHKPIGIYNIKEGGNIYRELSVYAEALTELSDKLLAVEKESFVLSAEDEGLAEIEKVFGASRDELEKEKRRKMILARFSLCSRDFTPASLSKIMDVLGINAEICEYPRQFRITFGIEGARSLAERKWIARELKNLLPAHLEADPVFEGFSFKCIDEASLTFGDMEQRKMCWADIDIYCKE